MPYCDTTVPLDLVTRVWTRERTFPFEMIKERLFIYLTDIRPGFAERFLDVT